MKHLYLISGLGADERIFQHLRFPEGYQVHYLPWLKPLPDEPYTQYAARMAEGIRQGPATLLGVSFGGMISLEIARQMEIEKTILISSIKYTRERPPYFNMAKKMKLLHLLRLPDSLLFKRRHHLVKYFMNAETAEERRLLDEYLRKDEYDYLRWAIKVVVNWENENIYAPVVHIHGGRDHTFPLRFVTPDYTIPTGGHLMVFNRAAEINAILEKELGNNREP